MQEADVKVRLQSRMTEINTIEHDLEATKGSNGTQIE